MDKKFSISDMLSFEKMVAPTVLKIIYYIGLVGIALYMLVAMAGAIRVMGYSPGMGLLTLIGALIGGCFGLLFWRVMIEVYTVLFGIYDRLGEVRDIMKKPDEG